MARIEYECPFKKYLHSYSYKNNKISQWDAYSLSLDCMAESGSPGLLSSPAPALLKELVEAYHSCFFQQKTRQGENFGDEPPKTCCMLPLSLRVDIGNSWCERESPTLYLFLKRPKSFVARFEICFECLWTDLIRISLRNVFYIHIRTEIFNFHTQWVLFNARLHC